MADIDLSGICDCCIECRSDLTTLYVTYTCAPNCDCRNGGTWEFSGPTPTGPGAWAWTGGGNPCACDGPDSIICANGTWVFHSCSGSGYLTPPGIPVNVVSLDPLEIHFGPWTHQSVNLCDYPDAAECTVIVTE